MSHSMRPARRRREPILPAILLVCLCSLAPLPAHSFQLPRMPGPADMEFRTKYRIIEYDPEEAGNGIPGQLTIYDSDRIEKVSPRKLAIHPPVRYQQFRSGKSWKGVEKEIVHNVLAPELVIILKNGNILKVSRLKEYPTPLGAIDKKRYKNGGRGVVLYSKVPGAESDRARPRD